MVFNSLEFGAFFGVCLAVYWLLPHRAQNRFLLIASYAFYGAWDWRFLGLIALSTAFDYAVGSVLGAARDARSRRRWVTASVAVNLSILATFKYANFFADGLIALAGACGLELPPFTVEVLLPVGVSFYTFQSLGYIVDVYRRRIEPVRDPLDFALFVAFFPQLVAGPIERADRLLPQIRAPRRLRRAELSEGAWLMLWGLFKKAVIADNLGRMVDNVYAPASGATGPEVLFATYAFAVQIYCDFSGYTDVARGSARLLGFDLMRNFATPYAAAGPAEFWRRWHISLSTWLRDYLYIPLGGSRGGRARTARNLMLTMGLGGLWHGAALTFVAWGVFHGAWLVAQRAARPLLDALRPAGGARGALWRGVCVVLTFHAVCFGWMLFRAESLGQVLGLLTSFVGAPEAGRATSWLLPFTVLVAPLVAVELAQAAGGSADRAPPGPVWVRVAVISVLAASIVLLGEDFGAPFIYFQF